MTEQNPITPSPELVEQWSLEAEQNHQPTVAYSLVTALATRAAQWGADQELEACCEWLVKQGWFSADEHEAIEELRAARRPQPLSLKQQALEAARIELNPEGKNGSLILRALEALPDD